MIRFVYIKGFVKGKYFHSLVAKCVRMLFNFARISSYITRTRLATSSGNTPNASNFTSIEHTLLFYRCQLHVDSMTPLFLKQRNTHELPKCVFPFRH